MERTAPGLFNDGRRAGARPVRVTIGLAALTICDAQSGAPLAVWPLGTVRKVDEARDEVRLTDAAGEARLSLPRAAITAEIAKRMPGLAASRRQGARVVGRLVVSAVALAMLFAALWFGWPSMADTLADLVPPEIEQRIGAQATDTVFRSRSVCDTPTGNEALARLARRLEPHAGARVKLSVQVLNDTQVNAFAAPGGYIVLFRGLIERAESPEEVAGVLAHEMGHVAARHSMRLLVRHAGWSMAAAAIFGDTSLATLGTFMLTLSYSREFEAEADARALAALQRAGIDPRGLSTFFARLERTERGRSRGGLLRYTQTHPPLGERREALAAAGAGAGGGPAMSAEDWAALRAICVARKPVR